MSDGYPYQHNSFVYLQNAITFFNTFKDHPKGVRLSLRGNTISRVSNSLQYRIYRSIFTDDSRNSMIDHIKAQLNVHQEHIRKVIATELNTHVNQRLDANIWHSLMESITHFSEGLRNWASLYMLDCDIRAHVDTIVDVTVICLKNMILKLLNLPAIHHQPSFPTTTNNHYDSTPNRNDQHNTALESLDDDDPIPQNATWGDD